MTDKPDNRAAARDLRQRGLSTRQIAGALNLSVTTVRTYLQNCDPPKALSREVHDLRNQGLPTSQIAARLGLPTHEIRRIVSAVDQTKRGADGWTSYSISYLRTAWERGDPASAISKFLGRTKSAVIGKAHRLGLSSRDTPIRPRQPGEIGMAPSKIQPWARHCSIERAMAGAEPLPPFHPIAASVLGGS